MLAVAASIDETILRGVEFLAGRRDQDGLWRDFRTEAGLASEWVTAAVLHALRPMPEGTRLIDEASSALIAGQRRDGGWGYNDHIPADADSTAWALRGLSGHGFVQPQRIRAALSVLLRHEAGDTGGFATFTPAAGIAHVIAEPDVDATQGWERAHVCVTANVALALIDICTPPAAALVRALAFLRMQRGGDGVWRSYWWRGPLMATYLALLALARGGAMAPAELSQSLDAIAARQNDDGGWSDAGRGEAPSHSFATTLGLLILSLGVGAFVDEREAAVRWLLRRQGADGSWPTAPILRVPDAHIIDPDAAGERYQARHGTNIVVADERGVFTAAFALQALHRNRLLAGGPCDD